MICCKECLELLQDYLDGSLDYKTQQELSEHFDDCPPCIAFMKTYKNTTTVCRENLRITDIPEEIQAKLQDFLKKNVGKK